LDLVVALDPAAMTAHALLAVIAANERTDRPTPAGLITLTCNEIRRLLTTFVIEPSRARACREAWSAWRRRQEAARAWI
jgi:hypothetical protein